MANSSVYKHGKPGIGYRSRSPTACLRRAPHHSRSAGKAGRYQVVPGPRISTEDLAINICSGSKQNRRDRLRADRDTTIRRRQDSGKVVLAESYRDRTKYNVWQQLQSELAPTQGLHESENRASVGSAISCVKRKKPKQMRSILSRCGAWTA